MSLRLRLFNAVSRLLIKPVLRRQKNVARARLGFRLTTRLLCRAPPFSVVLADDRIAADWVWSGRPLKDGALLYFHGGGYILGSPATHRAMVARLSRLTGLRALVPDYRLAPEYPFPAALADARAAWDNLMARGYRPGNIAIGGDSAGGGLVLALLAELCRGGQVPGAVFGFSPWTDLAFTGASLVENAGTDVFFPAERIGELRDMVAADADPHDPRLSPLYAEYPGCPPVLLQCSGSEILRDDTLRIAARLRGFGGQVTVDMLADAPHVWQLFDRLLPEAKASLEQVAAFIAASLRGR